MLQRWVGRLCFLLVSGCLTAGSLGCATTGPVLPGEKGLPVADPAGKGRILSDERVLHFAVDEDGEPAVTERSTRTVLIEGPRSKRLADDFVRYSRTFSRVTALAARSRTPDGKVTLFERDAAVQPIDASTPAIATVARAKPNAVPPGSVAVSRARIKPARVPRAMMAARGAPTLRTGLGNGGPRLFNTAA